ncbi:MAG: DUF4386 domain-containing protein [Chloroflexi bacterium]|nr:DUF4386 domain-containing protein [Chloroflexota bacterium]
MNDRNAARAAGVLFIAATVAGVLSRAAFVQPVLGSPPVVAGVWANETRVLLGALLLVVAAVSAAGIAIAMYPVLRRQAGAMALGSVGFRLIEGTLYLGVVVCLLVLVTLGREAAAAAPASRSAYDVVAGLVLAARDSIGEVSVVAFGVGASLYYWVFYRSRLVPRWLSVFGLVAIASLLASIVLVVAGVLAPFSPGQVVLAFPIAVQEMVLAAWLIVKGFSTTAATAPDTAVMASHAPGMPATAR